MSTLREAAQQALEALERPNAGLVPHNGEWMSIQSIAIAALRAALAEPVQERDLAHEADMRRHARQQLRLDCMDEEESEHFCDTHCTWADHAPGCVWAEPVQEPVAWQWLDTAHFRKKIPADATPNHWRPLYTAPPQRKSLTEDEIALIVADCSASAHRHDDFSFARAIERAHGI